MEDIKENNDLVEYIYQSDESALCALAGGCSSSCTCSCCCSAVSSTSEDQTVCE